MEFSILIPTRDRPDTFRHALATVVEQPGDDYEVIVADNCSRPEVSQIIEDVGRNSRRIKHIRSDKILPMAENWERGLENCSGRYVTVLGDDDAFLPSTLDLARKIVGSSQAKVLSWEVHNYWWPGTISLENANRLHVYFRGTEVGWIESRNVVRSFFVEGADFTILPMIYRAFVHTDIIQQAKNQHRNYFSPPDLSPDVASGVANLVFAERYVHSRRPLTICGMSRHSGGIAFLERSRGERRRAEVLKEEKRTIDQMCHPALITSANFHIIMASTKLWLREFYFPQRADLDMDLRRVVATMIQSLNGDPEAYDVNLADALALAKKIGFIVDPKNIPPRISPLNPSEQRPFHGPFGDGQNTFGVSVDCDRAGIYNAADAARLAEALSPTCNEDQIAQLTAGAVQSAQAGRIGAGKIGRNDPCPCGSGKRYKHCHGQFA
jgi:glycosyltransferase involved in cell wall biosynthesis